MGDLSDLFGGKDGTSQYRHPKKSRGRLRLEAAKARRGIYAWRLHLALLDGEDPIPEGWTVALVKLQGDYNSVRVLIREGLERHWLETVKMEGGIVGHYLSGSGKFIPYAEIKDILFRPEKPQ